RTDVYSLGVVLYEMVAGRPPFTGDNPVSIAYQHVREEAVPPSRHNPDVPPAFDAIVGKAMAKNRANRYSSADDLRTDLLRFNQGQTVSAAPVAPAVALTGVMAPGGGSPAPPPVETTRIQSGLDGTRVVPPGDTIVQYAEPPHPRTSTYIIILVVLLAMLGTLLFLVGRQLGVGGTEEVTVPQLIGLNETDADRQLRDAGLKPERREVQDEANPAGQVVSQDPLANTQVRKGATVVLSISTGAPIVDVPDVRNRTFDAAREALLAAGFRVGPANQVNSDKDPNTVLDQAPAAGTRQPKGSNITLTISKGVEQVAVPNVRGRTQSDAANLLGQAGFRTTSRQEASSDFDQGSVIRTEPAAGTPLERNSVVALIVSSGPAPTTSQPPVTAPPTTPQPTLLPTITLFPPTTSTTKPPTTSTTGTIAP
ncbi:MAG TPA: PASTA domain-containing protein, partial [Acidimicrobiales bacterium]|nr:PASTA domain-containing protein [Acidimicrobiales bacterium]